MKIEDIYKIALEAGKKIMEIYNDESMFKVVDIKADNSPLTLADKISNEIIVKGLEKIDPQIPIISEEGKDIPFNERKGWTKFWLVDPLDGTKEFINRNGEFTVNIALIENGYPTLGVIYVPATETLYYSVHGEGAYTLKDGNTSKISIRKQNKDLVAVGSRSHSSEEEKTMLQQFSIKEFKAAGSSLKFCLVAEGKADVYYRHNPTMEWDTGAGQAILEEAGGIMFNKANSRFKYNKESLRNESFLCLGDTNNLPKSVISS